MSNIVNLSMDQGSSFTYTFTLANPDNSPFSVVGFDARLQVRASYGSTSTLINCTLANGKLTLGSAAVTLVLAPDDTASIRFASKDDDSLEGVYDLEIVSPIGKVYKPAKGTFTLAREVTR
jgi:hypothetical protein